MAQITARIPDDIVQALDKAAEKLHRSRAEIIRQTIESNLEDYEDISIAIDRLSDPSDETIDWQEARRALLNTD